jgi:putative addiction module killer protein
MVRSPELTGGGQSYNGAGPAGTGKFINARGVGAGVYECRIDFGSGYRVYFGKDGATLVILLGGGTKKRQDKDIQAALNYWMDYKRRKER